MISEEGENTMAKTKVKMCIRDRVEAALKSYEDVDSWKTIIFLYNAALKEVGTKLEILNDEFQHVHPVSYTHLSL